MVGGIGVFQPLMHYSHLFGDCSDFCGGAFYFFQQRIPGAGINVLPQIADGAVFALVNLSGIRQRIAVDDIEQRGFAGTVRPD